MDKRSFERMDKKFYFTEENLIIYLNGILNDSAKEIESIKFSPIQTAKIVEILLKHPDIILEDFYEGDFDIFINIKNLTQFSFWFTNQKSEINYPYKEIKLDIYYYADTQVHEVKANIEDEGVIGIIKSFEKMYGWNLAVYESFKKLHKELKKYSFEDIQQMNFEDVRKLLLKADMRPDPF